MHLSSCPVRHRHPGSERAGVWEREDPTPLPSLRECPGPHGSRILSFSSPRSITSQTPPRTRCLCVSVTVTTALTCTSRRRRGCGFPCPWRTCSTTARLGPEVTRWSGKDPDPARSSDPRGPLLRATGLASRCWFSAIAAHFHLVEGVFKTPLLAPGPRDDSWTGLGVSPQVILVAARAAHRCCRQHLVSEPLSASHSGFLFRCLVL